MINNLPDDLFANCELIDYSPDGVEPNLWIHYGQIIEAFYVEGCGSCLAQFSTPAEVVEYKRWRGISND